MIYPHITALAAQKDGQSFPQFQPCPPAADRNYWESLDPALAAQLLENGRKALKQQWPQILATDYMDFSRTGNRDHFEAKQFARRNRLNALVLAESVEHQGTFMDEILNGLYLISEETAWQVPAHNSYIRDTPQFSLPDSTRPVVDLFAAETGSVLAVAEWLLREELQETSPFISARVNQVLMDRIFTPYLSRHFWWMGGGPSHMNNWTVWCTQNVLLAAFTRELPADMQNRILQQAAMSVDCFLEEYGEDGCCDEGAQYYRHAGLCLFGCLEVLNGVTDNAFQFAYETEKVKNIAAYVLKVHIDDIYYVNFADCSPVAGRCNAREYLFGKRTKNQDLMAFAASDYQKSDYPLTVEEHNLYYRLLTVMAHQEMTACEREPRLHHPEVYFESAGLFLARGGSYCLAVKAGDNDDSHNHNDTGSFTIYKDGRPLFIDVGVETYTKKTFSPQRYEIWTMQSGYHNLPTFLDGERQITQQNGPQYRAVNEAHAFGPESSWISMDIAKAYPDDRVGSYTRRAELRKGAKDGAPASISIRDQYHGDAALTPVLSLMFYEKPEIDGDMIRIGDLACCRVTGASSIVMEQIPITDPRLMTAWGHDIYRCLVAMDGAEISLEIQ